MATVTTPTLPEAPRFLTTPQIAEKRAQIVRANALERHTSYVYTPPSHRLLYRGSLAVPDSRLLLEGLTFTVPIYDSHSPSIRLLENTLALTLELMRGRSLLLSGTVRVDSVYLDKSGDISMDIHPAAFLSRLYFDNQLCAFPITAADGTTEMGVRIALGDPEDENSCDILVYGQLPELDEPSPSVPSSSTSSEPASTKPTLRLLVARILHAPLPTPTRLPRPDDPSPRFPPLISFGKKRRLDAIDEDAVGESSQHSILKKQRPTAGNRRTLSRTTTVADPMLFRARGGVTARIPKGADNVFGADSNSQPLSRTKSLGRVKSSKDIDVFKVPSLPLSAVENEGQGVKGKGKMPDIAKELQKANKLIVKRAASDCLATYGIEKTHPEFKELWGFVYRGAEFALRSHMQTRAIDTRMVDPIVKLHAEMYTGELPKAGSGRRKDGVKADGEG
ncbi:hypothetical protein FA95DRAFT_1678064 [Auriscalpium vulgare]|uniref:Uncharacterized protein n=1 Tax=Auriscalpium vulgare TaxID=40419 RepID=A0ACB8RY94_9AGAM|nr:hypothetical protein FA95DRAFT_1678064 [Auriscalpium vulgare]